MRLMQESAVCTPHLGVYVKIVAWVKHSSFKTFTLHFEK